MTVDHSSPVPTTVYRLLRTRSEVLFFTGPGFVVVMDSTLRIQRVQLSGSYSVVRHRWKRVFSIWDK